MGWKHLLLAGGVSLAVSIAIQAPGIIARWHEHQRLMAAYDKQIQESMAFAEQSKRDICDKLWAFQDKHPDIDLGVNKACAEYAPLITKADRL